MFKLKSQLSRFGLLAAGLVMLTLFTTLGGLWNYQGELAGQLASAQITGKDAKQTSAAKTGTSAVSQLAAVGQQPSPAVSNQKSTAVGQTATKNTSQSAANGQAAAAVSQPSVVSLGLSINGQFRGDISLPAGSNQCNVLNQALTDGVISSLDMPYNTQLHSYAVYVIDGIGDPTSVWWTYKVNGTAPPLGCSYVTAHNGDAVNWQYQKS